MKKKSKILIIKVIAVAVWLVTLLFPTIYAEVKPTKYVDSYVVSADYISEESNEIMAVFAVEFSQKVTEGTFKFSFKESENGAVVFSREMEFDDNNSKIVKVIITSEKFDTMAEVYYDIEYEVVPKIAGILDKVMYPIAIAIAIVLVFVLRIQYKEYEVDGKLIQIYAGVLNHTVYVDNIQAYSEKYLFTNKKTMLTIPVSNEHEMNIVFRANNRIETMTRNRPVIENGDVVVPAENIAGDSDVKLQELSSPAEQMIQTAPVQPESIQPEERVSVSAEFAEEVAEPAEQKLVEPVAETPAPIVQTEPAQEVQVDVEPKTEVQNNDDDGTKIQ